LHFRKDINGLRAIAVIAVVLFHFNASWMTGGFAGVDVFFVISGFLMTGIIFRGIEQENFSILKFYVARANRIIPALAVLCLVLLIFGWFYLTLLDYKALGIHVASSLGFLSNFIYWSESGYFDVESHEKWLLHTWSLSIEWQFYIIYPIVLVAMRKFMSIKVMKATVLLGTILGFIFCVIATYKWPNAAYYLLHTRAWEMMIGGVAYLYPIALKEERKKLLERFGLALIIGSYFLISKDSPWPGYLAIFPVLGSFFVIQAQRNDSFITSNAIFQKLGTWSYSIYLWHWPIVVIFYFLNIKLEVVGILLSVALGLISYLIIELKRIKLYPVAIVLLFTPFGLVTYNDVRDFDKAESFDIELEAFQYEYSNPDCNFRAYDPVTRTQIEKTTIPKSCYIPTKASVLLHGDSYSQHFYYGLEKNFNSKFDILQISAFSCRLEPLNPTVGCKASNDFFDKEIANINPNVLILVARTDIEKVNWDNYLSKVASIDKVLILGPSPENDFKYTKYGLGYEVNNWDYMQDTDTYMFDKISSLIDIYPNVIYVSLKDLLCANGKSSCLSEVKGVSMYIDRGHFSRAGSIEVIRLLKEIIQEEQII
jgi:peptidoglycan/LPS O-acetylase OafA/YrhL